MASSISSHFLRGHRRRHRRLVVLAGVLALVPICLAPRAARSAESQPQPSDEAGRRVATSRLVEGVELLKKGKYATALGKFDEAYALVPSPNIHYDRGLAYLGLGQNAAALEAFDAFLADATRPPEGTREQAQRHREHLRPRVARVELTSDPIGAEVTVDGRAYGPTPLGHAIYLEPGPHELAGRVRASGANAVERIAATAGQELKVTLKLAPVRVAVAPTPPSASVATSPASDSAATTGATDNNLTREGGSSSRARTWTIVAASGGAALLGAGLTFGLLARHYGDGLTRDSQQLATFDPSKEDHGLEYQTLEKVFLTVGAAALVGGVVAYVIQNRHASESQASRRPASSPRVGWSLTGAPLLGPALAGARVGVSF